MAYYSTSNSFYKIRCPNMEPELRNPYALEEGLRGSLQKSNSLSHFFMMKTQPPTSQSPPLRVLELLSPSKNWKREKSVIYKMISRMPLDPD
jgi:hypothetical protein